MNEPFRYGGETFYQSGYRRDPVTGVGTTTLQVVTNFGWMIPYVACMIVAIGMLAHFSQTLVRFLRRREEGRLASAKREPRTSRHPKYSLLRQGAADGQWSLIAVGFLAMPRSRPVPRRDEMDLYAFGKLPVEMGGRVQPIDTLARNSLRMISLREQYLDENGEYQPAVKWLLDLIVPPRSRRQPASHSHRQPRRARPCSACQRRQYFRYSWDEVNKNKKKLDQARLSLEGREAAKYTIYEKKLAELDRRLSLIELLQFSFLHRPIPKFPTEEEYKADPQATIQTSGGNQAAAGATCRSFNRRWPRSIRRWPCRRWPISKTSRPPKQADAPWQPYSVAWMIKYLDEIRHEPVDPSTTAWEAIFDAYAAGDARAFNRAVRRLLRSCWKISRRRK